VTVQVGVPFSIGDFLAGYYTVYGIETCSSLECAGEGRPVLAYDDGSYTCCACGTFRDPSEASC
jgi:hypothetical protein